MITILFILIAITLLLLILYDHFSDDNSDTDDNESTTTTTTNRITTTTRTKENKPRKPAGYDCEEFQIEFDRVMYTGWGFIETFYNSKNHMLIIHPKIGLKNKSTNYFIKIGIESKLFKNPYKLNLWEANELNRFDFDSDGVGNRWIDDERLILQQQSESEQPGQITLTTKPVPEQFKSNRIWLFEFFSDNQTERTKIGKLCLTESGDNGKLSMIFGKDQDCKYFPYVTTIPDCILVNNRYLYMFYSNHVDILTDWHLCNPFDHQNQQQQPKKPCIIHYKEIMLEKFFVCNDE